VIHSAPPLSAPVILFAPIPHAPVKIFARSHKTKAARLPL
jgi:hypothetical protein